jgi:hypothetical protein
MHGAGICPFAQYATEHDLNCKKESCEWWDEYENECAINLVVRLLRKIEGVSRTE